MILIKSLDVTKFNIAKNETRVTPIRADGGPVKAVSQVGVHTIDLLRDVERVHRRYLDLLRAELTKLGIDNASPAQVLMLFTIGNDEISVRDLLERGNYLGSNASYNLKRLLSAGYIEREASARDRRSARLRLAPLGKRLCETIRTIDRHYQQLLVRDDEEMRDLQTTIRTLRRVEMLCLTAMRYGDVVPDAVRQKTR